MVITLSGQKCEEEEGEEKKISSKVLPITPPLPLSAMKRKAKLEALEVRNFCM